MKVKLAVTFTYPDGCVIVRNFGENIRDLQRRIRHGENKGSIQRPIHVGFTRPPETPEEDKWVKFCTYAGPYSKCIDPHQAEINKLKTQISLLKRQLSRKGFNKGEFTHAMHEGDDGIFLYFKNGSVLCQSGEIEDQNIEEFCVYVSLNGYNELAKWIKTYPNMGMRNE